MYNICWLKNVGVLGTPRINKQINIVLLIHVRFHFTMTIDSELSERSLFSRSIINKSVYSINKTQQILHVCGSSSWMILWFVFIYVLFSIKIISLFQLYLWVGHSDSDTYLRIILVVYFSTSIWRLIMLTEICAYFIVNHCF